MHSFNSEHYVETDFRKQANKNKLKEVLLLSLGQREEKKVKNKSNCIETLLEQQKEEWCRRDVRLAALLGTSRAYDLPIAVWCQACPLGKPVIP